MDCDDYQLKAASTAKYYREYAITYPILGLAGEAGEVANCWKKCIRDDNGVLSAARKAKLIGELGGVAWYLAQTCTDLGIKLSDVLAANLQELAARSAANAIGGDGDLHGTCPACKKRTPLTGMNSSVGGTMFICVHCQNINYAADFAEQKRGS